MRAAIKFGSLTLVLLSLVIPEVVRAQGIVLGPDGKPVQQSFSLPYGFYNDKFGAAVGYAYGTAGYPQPQSTMLITAMGGSESSGMIFLIGNNLQVPFFDRLFLDPIVSVGYFSDTNSYVSGKPIYAGQQAGDNDSNKTDHIIGDGWDNYFRMNFKYLLPIGTGEDHIISVYKFNRGLLTSGAQGGQSWNPFKSGKTYLELRPFYRSQGIDGKYGDFKSKTNGLDFSVFWDNRDLPANPSTGNSIRLKLSRDFGWLNSTSSWTALFAEADKYFSLGPSDWFRQRVIALDFWTGYSPTWDVQPDGTVENRPPVYAGAFLGGLWRMRAYPSQRFSDRAAIYYGGELRMIPEWNPFDHWEWLQRHLGVQWVQLVPFAEVGRVAPDWGIERLHSDMKWDAGFGFRFLAKGLVLRIDSAYCDEGFGAQMMISQPFQF
jgi:outer membrane protein assembly factor BamA